MQNRNKRSSETVCFYPHTDLSDDLFFSTQTDLRRDPFTVCRSQKREHFFGGIPADAGIGNALPVNLGLVLSAFDQMAFHHHAHNIVLAVFQLRGNILGNFHLPSVIFTAVCVAAIDHQLGRQTGFY